MNPQGRRLWRDDLLCRPFLLVRPSVCRGASSQPGGSTDWVKDLMTCQGLTVSTTRPVGPREWKLCPTWTLKVTYSQSETSTLLDPAVASVST